MRRKAPLTSSMKLTPDNKGPDFGLAQLGQVALRIHDVDGAIEFYRDALGMKFLFSTGTMAFFDCGGVRLMLSMPERPEFDRPGSILYFKVDDLEAARSTMIDRGVRVRRRAPPDRANARPRTLDVVLQRPLGQHAGPHERGEDLTGVLRSFVSCGGVNTDSGQSAGSHPFSLASWGGRQGIVDSAERRGRRKYPPSLQPLFLHNKHKPAFCSHDYTVCSKLTQLL